MSEDRTNPENFKPGVYQHYKGDTYTAMLLVRHHETEELFVLYLSHDSKHGTPRMREWATPGKDSWTDNVAFQEAAYGPTGEMIPRFKFIRPIYTTY